MELADADEEILDSTESPVIIPLDMTGEEEEMMQVSLLGRLQYGQNFFLSLYLVKKLYQLNIPLKSYCWTLCSFGIILMIVFIIFRRMVICKLLII